MNIMNWNLFNEKLIVGDKPILNLQNYIDGMSLSMQDKLFFLNEIKFDCIVDFGCADGSTLIEIKKECPNVKLIGYDIDENMVKLASQKCQNAIISSNWNEVIETTKPFKSTLLNLSSVIHEVYSYSHASSIKKFWEKQVFGSDFKYISIRDMIPSTKINKDDIKSFKEDILKVKRKVDKEQLKSFEDKWGTIDDDYRTFTHFLLKYRFKDNWNREVNENYLPISLETLKTKIPNNYNIIYEKDFILPFLKQQVLSDFNVEMKHSTHTKMILKRND